MSSARPFSQVLPTESLFAVPRPAPATRLTEEHFATKSFKFRELRILLLWKSFGAALNSLFISGVRTLLLKCKFFGGRQPLCAAGSTFNPSTFNVCAVSDLHTLLLARHAEKSTHLYLFQSFAHSWTKKPGEYPIEKIIFFTANELTKADSKERAIRCEKPRGVSETRILWRERWLRRANRGILGMPRKRSSRPFRRWQANRA